MECRHRSLYVTSNPDHLTKHHSKVMRLEKVIVNKVIYNKNSTKLLSDNDDHLTFSLLPILLKSINIHPENAKFSEQYHTRATFKPPPGRSFHPSPFVRLFFPFPFLTPITMLNNRRLPSGYSHTSTLKYCPFTTT